MRGRFRPPGGGGIYIVDNTSAPHAEWKERTIIDESSPNSLGKGVYTHPEVSWDGKRLLFCYKDTPKGNTCIYEIGIDGKGLRKISDPSTACICFNGKSHISGMHDISPAYLPDDRIVDGLDLRDFLLKESPSPRNVFYYYRGNELYAVRKGPFKAHFKFAKPICADFLFPSE